MRDILLIEPLPVGLDDPLAYPPLGLMYLASNMGRHWNPSIKVLVDENTELSYYDYYGISVHSIAVVELARKIMANIMRINPSAQIYLGGSASNMVQEDIFYSNVTVIRGEGEEFFGKDTRNLDNINFPARDLVPYEMIHYTGGVHHTTEPSTTMIATRGCIFNCAFCDRLTHGNKFRKRSIQDIKNEIEILKDIYGIKWIRFCDDCITLDRKWFLELCDELAYWDIKWTCMARSDRIDDEMLMMMKRGGCQEIFFGFESGSQKILDMMNKRNTVENNEKAVELCRNHGITSCAYIMFGFPGEDEKTVDETIDFLERTQPDKARLSEFVPFQGTDVWYHPDKYDVRIKGDGYWYYDNDELSLKYNYIPDHKMLELRSKMRDYFSQYKKGWTK